MLLDDMVSNLCCHESKGLHRPNRKQRLFFTNEYVLLSQDEDDRGR